jgi:Ca2+-binding RTX toxin-like protein
MANVRGNSARNFIHRLGDGSVAPPGYDDITGVTLGDDVVNGLEADDILFGDAGNDQIIGGPGIDRMTGGPGDDLFYVDNAGDQVFEDIGGGNDRLLSSVNYTLAAGQEIELLTTNAVGVAPVLGTDPITLTGNEFAQRIEGNAAANALDGAGGDDALYGFDGDDTLIGGAGADFLAGGQGYNYASYASATAGVVVNLGNPSLNTGDAAGDVYWSHAIQGLIGSSFGDVLTADGRQSEVVTLNGGAGNDTLVDAGPASGGQVNMEGGLGDDTYYVNALGQFGVSDDRILEKAGEGFDRVITTVDVNLRFSNPGQEIELLETPDINGTTGLTLEGNGFTTTIIGNAGQNFMQGDFGDDTIFGADGNDQVYGLRGNDTLHGGNGSDRLFGNAGLGDAGQDDFVFDTPLNDVGWHPLFLGTGTNVDRIIDFSSAEHDRILLDDITFATLAPGALPANAFIAAASGPASGFGGLAATDADDRITYNTANGILSYDPDGTGPAGLVRFAYMASEASQPQHPVLTASDFFVI